MAVFDFLAHNWGTRVEMDTVWQTNVVQSPNRLAEARRSLVASPRRLIDVSWQAMNRQDATRLYFQLMRIGQQRIRIPLYQDVTVATGPVAGTNVPCDTTFRRFYEGQRVAIHSKQSELVRDLEYGVIDVGGVAPGGLTLDAPLANTYAAGASVYPVIDVEQQSTADLQAITDGKATVGAQFNEVYPTIPAALSWSDLGSEGFVQLLPSNAYVLDIGPEWKAGIRFGMTRPGRTYNLGRDVAVEGFGPRALTTIDLGFTHKDREEFFRLLKFFDAHRGRAIPFWVECPLVLFSPVLISPTDLVVEKYGDLENYQDFVQNLSNASPWIFLRLKDGTRIYRRIDVAFEPSPTTISLTANGGYPAITLDEIDYASLAFFVRLRDDAMTESWPTNEACETRISVVELLRDEIEAPGPGQDGFFTGGIGELCA